MLCGLCTGVKQGFSPSWRAECAKALLDRLQHHVAHIRAADPGIDHGPPGDYLAVAGVDDERAADDVAIPAGELEAVRAPAQVRAQDDDLAVVGVLGPLGVFAREQEAVSSTAMVLSHFRCNTFVSAFHGAEVSGMFRRNIALVAATLAFGACGGSDSDGGPGSSTGPNTGDPNAWSQYFVTSFDEAVVSALRSTAAFADHTISYTMQVTGHPAFGGAGRQVESNALLAARVDYAHSVGLTGAGQIISMLDSALRTTHEQFSGKTIYVSGSGAADDHGTAVGSIMVGTGGSGTSIGVAPGANLHSGVLDFTQSVSWDYLASVMRDAHSLGAVASNNSWGVADMTVANTNLRTYFEHPARFEYIRSLREFTDTGVVVFAAGNDYNATSVSGLAGLPTAFPDLEGNWLAVINAIPEFDNERILSAERVSSACLEAARWCLTADGQVRAAMADGNTAYGIGSGSSFAAPQVSGAVALLAEAFPNLSAGQLRDRMLATADNGFFTHSGTVEFAPGISHGYNEEFGHGFLNLRAALLPIGDHLMPTSAEGTRRFGEVALIAGGASGDAAAQALAAVQVISMDGLHGTFETDASHLAATMAGGHDRPVMLARAASVASTPLYASIEPHAVGGGFQLPEIGSEYGSLRLIVPDGQSEVAGMSLRRTLDVGPGMLTVGLGFGAQGDGVMGLRIPSGEGHLSGRTASVIMGYDLALGPHARFGIETEFGRASGRAAGMIDRIEGMRFSALNLRYSIGDVAVRGDRLSLSVSRPVALTAGQATMTLPVAMSGGSAVFEPVSLGLAPATRQLDLALEYARPVNRHTRLRMGVVHSTNQGHRAGARETSAVVGVAMRF